MLWLVVFSGLACSVSTTVEVATLVEDVQASVATLSLQDCTNCMSDAANGICGPLVNAGEGGSPPPP